MVCVVHVFEFRFVFYPLSHSMCSIYLAMQKLSHCIFHVFSVLPKYEVKINVPQRVSPYDEEFKVEVCAE